MRVFNITDVPTPSLTGSGLTNVAIKVGDTVIPAGQYRDLRGTAREESELSSYLRVGAAVKDQLPSAYAQARGLSVDGQEIVPGDAQTPEAAEKAEPTIRRRK